MANDPKPSMSTRDTLLHFSEWLDSEHLIVGDQADGADKRTHEQLAEQFIEHWEADERGANLAGRAWERMVASVTKTFNDVMQAMPEDVRKSLGL